MEMTFLSRPHCPLCGSVHASVFIDFDSIPVMRCPCGFIFSGRTLSADDLHRFYAEEYGGDRHFLGQKVNAAINAAALRRLLPLDPVERFLEVGSGYGFLLRRLRDRFGMAVTGVELSEQEARHASDQLGVPTLRTLSAPDLAAGGFDVVAAFEVIEHVLDPMSFLDQLAPLVRPGGALVIMTDNFESAVAARMGGGFPKWIPHQHVSHFSHVTLPKMIGALPGFRLEAQLSYTPWELHLLALLRRSTRQDRFDLKREMSTEMTRGYRYFRLRQLANTAWAQLTFSRNLRGALMYVVARRIT